MDHVIIVLLAEAVMVERPLNFSDLGESRISLQLT